MAISFPSNPTLNQTYSSGSSATYQWNGSFWDTIIPTTQVFATAVTASFAQSSSFSRTASFVATASFSQTASFVATASTAVTASRLTIINPAPLTGSLIPTGSSLSYNPSTNTYIVDTVEGIANNGVAFVTPWNFSLMMDQSNQQFYIRVDATGATRYAWGMRTPSYFRISSDVYNTNFRARPWTVPTVNTWYAWWGDLTLDMAAHGDTEWGTFRAAISQDAYSLGKYEEYQLTMVLGYGFNNNYFRVIKTK